MKSQIVILISALVCGCVAVDGAFELAGKTESLASQTQMDVLRERGVPDVIDDDEWSTWTYRKSGDVTVTLRFCYSGQHIIYRKEGSSGVFVTHCRVDSENTKPIRTVAEAKEILRMLNIAETKTKGSNVQEDASQ